MRQVENGPAFGTCRRNQHDWHEGRDTIIVALATLCNAAPLEATSEEASYPTH